MGIVLDSTVLIAAERAGKTPRQVIADVAAGLGDTEVTLSVVTVIELAHGIERANSAIRRITREHFLDELGYAVATANVRHFEMIPNLVVHRI